MIRNKEGEVCPQLCPEPLRSAQAALLGTLVGTGGLCLRKFSKKNIFRCTSLALVKTAQDMYQGRTIRVGKFGLVQFLCEGNKNKFHECFLYKDQNGNWLSIT